jgi:DNA-binding Lrp family transcriptional regulator
MDEKDRELLNEIQSAFPLERRPYQELGRRVGLDEGETLTRITRLRREGIIRRIGASIDSRRIGFVSTLLAAAVPEDKLDPFIHAVNSCPGVTHNYLRKHEYNVWFTLICPSEEEKIGTIRALEAATGVSILELPAKRIFKIRVDFKF